MVPPGGSLTRMITSRDWPCCNGPSEAVAPHEVMSCASLPSSSVILAPPSTSILSDACGVCVASKLARAWTKAVPTKEASGMKAYAPPPWLARLLSSSESSE